MSECISEKYSDDESVPRTYLKQNGKHIRLDLSREQFEEFEERDVHMESYQGGVLIDCSKSAQPLSND